MPDELSVDEVTTNPDLADILVRHAYRGVRVQFALRALLVAFMTLSIIFVPPTHGATASWAIVACYLAWAVAVTAWTRRGGVGPVRWMWVALLVDAGAIAALTVVAGASAEQTWTADLLVNGFFVIPMLAATQLRPWVCAVIAIPTTIAYLAVSIATKTANTEPWASILLRTLVLAGLGVGCVALSRVQLSRVVTIGRLVRDRGELLTELVSLEARQRAELAERLHDGALQYLLAARQDVDDARDLGDPAAFDRLEQAIRESSQMLRTTVSELHPAVLAQAGLAHALQDLATATATRSRLTVDLELDEWPDRPTAADTLMFNAAKEILTNVVKHAHAQHVAINLEMRDGTALLTVADDGRGVTEGVLDSKLADGHIGLASQRARVAAAGGRLTVEPAHPCGTLVTVSLPVRVPALERARP